MTGEHIAIVTVPDLKKHWLVMEKADQRKLVRLDGRTGEGGGQVVRIAVALAALTGTPLAIDNVRGNRPGKRGGGKPQIPNNNAPM